MSIVHPVAQTGFGTGTNELYDRARPSYQPYALSHIRQAVKASPPLNVVEVGAGTGIFTRAFLAHDEWASAIKEVKAVEPSEGMRGVFTKTVTDQRVSVSNGTFEEIPVEDSWADLIVIAQAFHWCPNYDRASAEFARILKPGGVLALIWNLEDRDAARWVAQLRDRIEQHENGTPQFRLNLWRETFETPSYNKFFAPPLEKFWSYTLPGTIDIVSDRAFSKSYIAILPDDEKKKVKEDVQAIVERGDDKVWTDEAQGVFEYPHKTYVVIANRK